MLMMRVTQNISERPAAMKNRPEAAARTSSAWNRRALKLIERSARAACCGPFRAPGGLCPRGAGNWCVLLVAPDGAGPARMNRAGWTAYVSPQGGKGAKRCELSVRGRRAQLPDLGVGGQHRAAVDVLEIHHHRLAVLDRSLADVGAHRGLVIDGPIGERAERAVDLQSAERRDELFGVGRARL